jgi:hypothetical protein
MGFHVEHGVSALVAAAAGAGTYGMRATTLDAQPVPYLALAVTLISTIVAGAVAWGMLQADHRRTRRDVEKMSEMMLETVQRLSRIEAKLE